MKLLPKEGRRSLLRAAQARGTTPSVDALHRAARALLPLPPYEVWVPAYLANRSAFLERLGVPTVPARTAPVTVAIRPVGSGWWAHLNLRRTDDGWVGYIAFHLDPASAAAGVSLGTTYRTADIFRDADPEALRARFLEFGEAAMEGFLRSVSA